MDLKTTGRLIGGLALLQLVLGILLNAVFTAPLFSEGGYLVNASAISTQLGYSVLLALAGSLIALTVAILAQSVFRAHSPALALSFLSLTVLGMALSGVEQMGILAMREFSEAYSAGDGAQRELMESLRVAGSGLRNGAHYVSLLASGVTLGVWYYCLLRFSLLPRPLAYLGLVAVCLQLFAISQPILGGEVSFALLAPLALAQLLQGGWLLVFGFPGDD